MSETQTPVDEGFMRAYKELERKVADIGNAAVSGSQLSPGDLIASAAATRAGALLCDGTSYLRGDFPALFDALGGASSPYGLPDGTHFNVPDYRGYVLGGVGGSLPTLGTPVGAASVTLTAAQSGLPAHLHTMPAATGSTTPGVTGGPSTANTGAGTAHAHAAPAGSTGFVAAGLGAVGAGAGFNWGTGANTLSESAHTHSLSSHTHTSAAHTHTLPDTDSAAAAPAASAHSVVQPTLPANIFVKT